MNMQHTGNTFTRCPVAQMRRKMITLAMLATVGLAQPAIADAPTGEIGNAPTYCNHIALPVVVR